MAKDSEIEDDDIVERDQDERITSDKEPAKDVRSAIRNSIKELNEKSEKESDEIEDKDNKKEEKNSGGVPKSFKKEIKKEVQEEPQEKEIKEEPKIEPPPFWKNKGKTTWEKLSPEDKQVIINREKEVSDGFANTGSKLKEYEELEKVISPRLQAIQRFGVTPAETINRLFHWMEALSDSNIQNKANSFKQLAQSFGLDLNQLVPKQKSTTEDGTTVQEPVDNNSPPEWFSQFTGTVQGELGALKQTLATQQQAAAEAVVMNWAKDKPHFGAVRRLMAQLSSSGAVPLKNGTIDLDGSYEAAVKLHPEIAAQVQQEATEKAANEAREKSQKEASDAANKLARAKKAGAGLKPAAPSMGQVAKLNGKTDKPSSVRASIKAALDELRE